MFIIEMILLYLIIGELTSIPLLIKIKDYDDKWPYFPAYLFCILVWPIALIVLIYKLFWILIEGLVILLDLLFGHKE